MKSLCFIPVYNQVREFPKVLDELASCDFPCDVLLVNNGSSDGSEDLVHQSGYTYIDLPENKGIGHSFMVAMDWALEHQYEIFSVIASNAKMLPSEMQRVLQPILDDEADYVTGSRFLKGGDSPNLPGFRKNAIPMVNIFVRLLTGAHITDATCGYKAYRTSLFRQANFDWHAPWLNTYGFEYYVYGKVVRDASIRWAEVPITMRYPPKGQSYTKMKAFKSWYEMLKPWVIARFDRQGFNPKGT